MDETLCKLYFGDSSDEEETFYSTQSMQNKIESLKDSGKSYLSLLFFY